MLYDSIPGKTYIINDEPYEVHAYARVTTPINCDGSTAIVMDRERLECVGGRQVGAPAAFALGPADANNSLWIGDALTMDECDVMADDHARAMERDAFTVTYSMDTCDCLFPFTYDGTVYNQCTDEDTPAGSWCATSPVCQSRFSSDPASICQLDLARRTEGAYAECRGRGLDRVDQVCPAGFWQRGCFVQLDLVGRQDNLTANLTSWRSCQYQRFYYTEEENIPLRGVIAGIAGRPFEFTLTSRDIYGNVQNNPIYAQSDEYEVEFYSLNDTRAEVFQDITPDGTGVYTVSLTAQAIGTYAVTIALGGEDILNPSFYLDVQTSSVHPETSILSGPGLVLFPVAQTTSFTAQLRDRFGNLAACTEATIDTVILVGLGNMTDIEFEAYCSGQNAMTATYMTTISGDYMLNVSATNGSISISPGLYGDQLWPVLVEPAVISAQKSTVFFVTTADGAIILPGSTATAKLDLQDRFGNPTDLRLDARGVDLSSGLRLTWTHMPDNDAFQFRVHDPSGEMPSTTTSLLELLDGESPVHSGSSSTIVPGGLRDDSGNYTTTFVPQAYGRYTVRAVVTVDCFDDGTGSLPLECADLDDCVNDPCGPPAAGTCTDLGRRIYRCDCEPGYHYSAGTGSCVATDDRLCPRGANTPGQSPPDCIGAVWDEADCPPMRSFLADVLTGNSNLTNITNSTIGQATDLLSEVSGRNCTGLAVLTLHSDGVYAFTDTFELDIGGSPGSFFVELMSPPNATQASLTSSGLALQISFDSLTNRARMGANVLPCTYLLRAVHTPYEEAAMRVQHPEGEQTPISAYGALMCSWESAQVLSIDLTSGTNSLDIIRERVFGIANQISILPRVLRQAENSATIHNKVEIVQSHDPPRPQAVLTAPVVLPYCDQLVLDASASYGTGGELTYEWNVAPGTPQRIAYENNEAKIVTFGTDTEQIALNSRDMIDWLTALGEDDGLKYTSTIYVPQLVTVGDLPETAQARYPGRSDSYNVNLFQPGTNSAPGALNFSVTVTNVFGESSTAHAAVTRSMESPPVVSLPSVAERVVYSGEAMYLEASIRLSSCFNVWHSSPQISWRWSMLTAGGEIDYSLDASMDAASRNTSTLRLLSTGLTPGNSYEVVASAQMISDPTLVGFASAMISVAYSGVQAQIASVPSSVSAVQVLELDATSSFDRDDPATELVYRWSWQLYGAEDGAECIARDSDARDIAVRSLAMGSSGTLVMPHNILAPDQRCTFTVRINGLGPEPGYASKIMTIVPAEVLPPDVRIEQLMPPPEQTQVTASAETVVMEGVIASATGLGNFDAAAGCEWRLVDGELPDHDIEWYRRPINNAVSRLILPPGTLTEAQVYYVRFACFLDGHEGFADITFKTNRPPRLGTMTVHKLSEVSLSEAPTLLEPPMIIESDLPFIDLQLQTDGWVDEPDDTPFAYTFSTQRSCADSDRTCVNGLTNPVVLGSSGTNKRTATIANIGTTNVTVAVRATDRPGADSELVKHYISFQGPAKDDAQSINIADGIMENKFATAAATGDVTAVMQLASVLAGILTPSSDRRMLTDAGEVSGDGDIQLERAFGKDHPAHPDNVAARRLQDTDEIRGIQQQIMNALTAVVDGAKPPSHVIYQYLAAVADIAWVTDPEVHRCCMNPGSSGCFSASCSYGFEMQALDYIGTVLEQAQPHGMLVAEAAAAAARAIDGVLIGMPQRDTPDTFWHGRAMAMTQFYYNYQSSDAGTYVMKPSYAVRNCDADTWSVAYARENIATRVSTQGFSELEFIPRPCGQGSCVCADGETGCWEVVRMGGMISGTLTTCAGGDVTNKLKDATNTMALAVQLATVCGQDPVLQRGRTFLQSSERTCVAQATSTLFSVELSEDPADVAVDDTGAPVRELQAVRLGAQVEWSALIPDGEAVAQATAVWKDPQYWGYAGDYMTPLIHFAMLAPSFGTELAAMPISVQFTATFLDNIVDGDKLAPQCVALVPLSRGGLTELSWSGRDADLLCYTVSSTPEDGITCACAWDAVTRRMTYGSPQHFAVLAVSSQCQLQTDCFSCHSNPDCGWCESTQTCFEGNTDHPYHPSSCPGGWTMESCPCSAFDSCDTCLAPVGVDTITGRNKRACGFCPRLESCLEVTDNSTCGDHPGVVGWVDMNTTCPTPCDSEWGDAHGYEINACPVEMGVCRNYTTCICHPGRFGPECSSECPGSFPRFDGTLEVCSMRGECDDGNSGTGHCTCEPNSGYGASRKLDGTIQTIDEVDCADCDTTHWGEDCNQTCPGIVTTSMLVGMEVVETFYACSRKGVCSSGHAGIGECDCDEGYWTYNCSEEVPGGAPGVTTAVIKLDLDYDVYLMMANFEQSVQDDLALVFGIPASRIRVTVTREIISRRSLQSNETTVEAAEPKAIVTFTIMRSIGAVTFTAEDIHLLLSVGMSVANAQVMELQVIAAGPCFGHGTVNRSATAEDELCICDPGYWGPDCKNECAGGAVPTADVGLCLGRGICDDGNRGDGTCFCLDGYRGSYCQAEPLRVLVEMRLELPADLRLTLDTLAQAMGLDTAIFELLKLVPATADLADDNQIAVFEIRNSGPVRATDEWTRLLSKHQNSDLTRQVFDQRLNETVERGLGYTITALRNRTFVNGIPQECPVHTCEAGDDDCEPATGPCGQTASNPSGGGDCEIETGLCLCTHQYTGLACDISLDVLEAPEADLTSLWIAIGALLGGFAIAAGILFGYIEFRRRKRIKEYEEARARRRRRSSQRSNASDDEDDHLKSKNAAQARFRRLSSLFGDGVPDVNDRGAGGGGRGAERARRTSVAILEKMGTEERTDEWLEKYTRLVAQVQSGGLPGSTGETKTQEKYKVMRGVDGEPVVVPVAAVEADPMSAAYRQKLKEESEARRKDLAGRDVMKRAAADASRTRQVLHSKNRGLFDQIRKNEGGGYADTASGQVVPSRRRGGKRTAGQPVPRIVGSTKPKPTETVTVLNLNGQKVELEGDWDGHAPGEGPVQDDMPQLMDAPALERAEGPRARAVRDFVAHDTDTQTQFDVKRGDVIVLKEADDSKNWWVGSLESAGADAAPGEFPKKFVERIEEVEEEKPAMPSQSQSGADQVYAFLEALELEGYAQLFKQNMVDMETLHEFSEDDLWELGVPKGPRVKIRNALSRVLVGEPAAKPKRVMTAASDSSASTTALGRMADRVGASRTGTAESAQFGRNEDGLQMSTIGQLMKLKNKKSKGRARRHSSSSRSSRASSLGRPSTATSDASTEVSAQTDSEDEAFVQAQVKKAAPKTRKTGLKLEMRRPDSSGSNYSGYSEEGTERGSSDEELRHRPRTPPSGSNYSGYSEDEQLVPEPERLSSKASASSRRSSAASKSSRSKRSSHSSSAKSSRRSSASSNASTVVSSQTASEASRATTPEAKPKAEPAPQKSKGPSLRASARFASATAGMAAATSLTKAEREAADFAKQAREERDRVRALIQAVATESERVETELAEQTLGSRLQGIAEQDGGAPKLPTAKALRNFNLMKDGDVIAEIREGDTVVLTDEGAEKRWWRGYVEGEGSDNAGEFLQKFVERSSTPDDKTAADDGADEMATKGGGRRRRGGMVLGLEEAAAGLEGPPAEEEEEEEVALPSLAELAGSDSMGIDSHLSALQALLKTDEPEPEVKAAAAFKRGLGGSSSGGGAGSDAMTESITRAVEEQNGGAPQLLSPSRGSDSGASSLSDSPDRHAFESGYFNQTVSSMGSTSTKHRKDVSMTKYRERLSRMDEAQVDLRAEINDRLSRLTGATLAAPAPAPEPAPEPAPAKTSPNKRRGRGIGSGPRSTQGSIAQMDSAAMALAAAEFEEEEEQQESAQQHRPTSSPQEAAASESLLAVSDDAAASAAAGAEGAEGGAASGDERPSSGRARASGRSPALATTATATGPLARLLARRSETAVDRLASGKTTSHKRPGSGQLLTPAQVAEKRQREAEAAAAAEDERLAKEARKAAKAKALAGKDTEESKKKAAAKAAALAERAAPQQQKPQDDKSHEQPEGEPGYDSTDDEGGDEEEGDEEEAAERGNITALMMTTSLTRRDRRVQGRDREPEPEPEPEAITTARSSHSSSSSGSRRSKQSSAESEAEEVKAKLDAVNERLARLGRR
jgi:hypothetical protein